MDHIDDIDHMDHVGDIDWYGSWYTNDIRVVSPSFFRLADDGPAIAEILQVQTSAKTYGCGLELPLVLW